MKRRLCLLAVVLLGLSALVLLVEETRALRTEAIRLTERITQLEQVQMENAELKDQLSRQQAADWELDALRRQARDVPRLRGQVSELLRLRQENGDLLRQTSQLTNQLVQLAQEIAELHGRSRNIWSVTGELQGTNGLRPWEWAHMPADQATKDAIQNWLLDRIAGSPEGAQPYREIPLPPNHPKSDAACSTCHPGNQSTVQPELRRLWLDLTGLPGPS